MLILDLAFWFLSLSAILAALGVVLVKDLFRAALLLAVVFVAVAGLFVMMSAQFLAVVQVLIYVGAISILIIFAVMLTRDVQRGNLANGLQVPAVLFPALLLAALIVVAVVTDWGTIPEADQDRVALVQTQSASVLDDRALDQAGFAGEAAKAGAQRSGLADLLIGRYVLPFEAVSVLLLAAVIGALALARPRQGEG
jgi:NADH:ubiquinone oxidoreductase subunit 6 (subunit J)